MLLDKDRQKLDSIVEKMSRNNESDENIQFVVDDFKSIYDKKEQPILQPSQQRSGYVGPVGTPMDGSVQLPEESVKPTAPIPNITPYEMPAEQVTNKSVQVTPTLTTHEKVSKAIEKVGTPYPTQTPKLGKETAGQALVQGAKSANTDIQYAREVFGQGVVPEADKMIADYEQMIEASRPKSGIVKGTVNEISRMLPAMGAGIAGGAVTSLVGHPEVGSLGFWYLQGVGSQYKMLKDNGIDESVAKPISIIAGAPYALIESSIVGTIAAPVKKMFVKASKDAAERVVQGFIKQYGVDWAKNVTQEGLQAAIQQEAVEIGRFIDTDAVKNSMPKAQWNVLKAVWDATLQSALSMAGLLGATHGIKKVSGLKGELNQALTPERVMPEAAGPITKEQPPTVPPVTPAQTIQEPKPVKSPIRDMIINSDQKESLILAQAEDIKTVEIPQAIADGDANKVVQLNKKLEKLADAHEAIITSKEPIPSAEAVAVEQPVAQIEQPTAVEPTSVTEPTPEVVPVKQQEPSKSNDNQTQEPVTTAIKPDIPDSNQITVKQEVGNFAIENKDLLKDGNKIGRVDLKEDNNQLWVADIEMSKKGTGVGTEFFKSLKEKADKENKLIVLTSDAMRGKESQKRNRKFYESLGFIKNTGENKIKETKEEFYYKPNQEVIPNEKASKETSSQDAKNANEEKGQVLKTETNKTKKVGAVTGSDLTNQPSSKIEDFGEKIGGARKDIAVKTGPRSVTEQREPEQGWRNRYKVTPITSVNNNIGEEGKFYIYDTRKKQSIRGGNGYGKALTFNTKEEAMNGVALSEVARNHRVASSGDEYIVERIVSESKRFPVVKGFVSREEAMKYMALNAEDIIQTKIAIGKNIKPYLEKVERTLPSIRKGNADAKMFQDRYGFRGVEFGLWNNQYERQQVMNQAYDALNDMANALGLPMEAMSLNGQLALAFGARGKGLSGAAAHYERDFRVINLTKEHGAGTLAHEWMHAIDHYLGIFDGQTSSLTDVPSRRRLKGVEEKVLIAFTELESKMLYKEVEFTEDKEVSNVRIVNAEKYIDSGIERLRSDLKYDRSEYAKRNAKPMTEAQEKRFDDIIKEMKSLDSATIVVNTPVIKSKYAFGHQTTELGNKLSALYQEVRGSSGYLKGYNGAVDRVNNEFNAYYREKTRLKDANAETKKTRKVQSDFYKGSRDMDRRQGVDYWSTPAEMMARAMESNVFDKIDESGNKSQFLVHSTNNAVYKFLFDAAPYPEGQERTDLNKSFKKLFDAIGEASNLGALDTVNTAKAKASDGGDSLSAKFRTGLLESNIEVTQEQMAEINALNYKIFGDTDVNIVSNIIQQGNALGMYNDGMIDILDKQADPLDTFYHEAVHKYLNVVTSEKEKADIISEIAKKHNLNSDMAEEKLAEDFIKYAKNRQGLTGKIKAYIDKAVILIKKLLGKNVAIDKLYNDIMSGNRNKTNKPMDGVPRFRQSTRESQAFKRYNDEYSLSFHDLPTYTVMNMAEQRAEAEAFVRDNPDEAQRIGRLESAPPEGILQNSIDAELARLEILKAPSERDPDVLSRQSLRLTQAGQEIASQAGRYTQLDPEFWINKVMKERADKGPKEGIKESAKTTKEKLDKELKGIDTTEARRKILKKWARKGMSGDELTNAIKKINKMDLSTDNKFLNGIADITADKHGVSIKKDEVNKIITMTNKLKESYDPKLPYPSPDYFANKDALDKYTDGLTPTNRARIVMSSIWKGMLLASIKSPIVNISSNTFFGAMGAIERRAMSQTVKGTSTKEALDFIRDGIKIFNKSGYDISRMLNLTDATTIRGEKQSSSQGAGIIRKVGRFMERSVFKPLYGFPDTVASLIIFSDTANLLATKKAASEGLTGTAQKQRASELFIDSTRLEPLTKEGLEIRQSAQMQAFHYTYTNSSGWSDASLKGRQWVNSILPGAGDVMAPFVKTPANVVGAGLGLSGFDGVMATRDLKAAFEKTQKGESNKEELRAAINHTVRLGLGLISAMLLAAMIDDDDYMPSFFAATEEERQLAKNKNTPFNAVHLGDKWVSLDYFGPIMAPTVGMLYAKRYGNTFGEKLSQYARGVGIQLISFPLISDLADSMNFSKEILSSKNNKDYLKKDSENWSINFVSSIVMPMIISDIAIAMDEYQRKPESSVETIMAKIPGVREKLGVKMNIFGEEMRTEGISQIFFGSRVKTSIDNEVFNELERLNDTGFMPNIKEIEKTSQKVKELKKEIDPETFREAVQVFGVNFYAKLEKKIQRTSYQRKTDEEKKEIIMDIKSDLIKKVVRHYNP